MSEVGTAEVVATGQAGGGATGAATGSGIENTPEYRAAYEAEYNRLMNAAGVGSGQTSLGQASLGQTSLGQASLGQTGEDEYEGYDPNDYLSDDVKDANFSKYKDFNSLVKDLKTGYLNLKRDYDFLHKGFNGKVEQWSPEVIQGVAEKVRGTVYGIPKDPSGYDDLQDEHLNGLLERYQTSLKNKEEKADFLIGLKTGAYLNGVPKDKLGTFAETYLSLRQNAFAEANAKQQEFFAKQEKDTEKAWGENLEGNRAMIFQYLSGILPKAHPDGAEAGKRAADILVRSGAIKNKDVANLFLDIIKDYFPKSAKVPSPSQSVSVAAGNVGVSNLSMSQRR